MPCSAASNEQENRTKTIASRQNAHRKQEYLFNAELGESIASCDEPGWPRLQPEGGPFAPAKVLTKMRHFPIFSAP
jgi:hypothetical protein